MRSDCYLLAMRAKTKSPARLIFVILLLFIAHITGAQDRRVLRIAKIQIDPMHIEDYKTAVKEQIEAAIRIEPGVLMLYAVHDKKVPTNVTVFEIYTDTAAYQLHLQTAHFKKYKKATAHMVRSLELVDVSAIELRQKH
jgi:quinol monooxygenase YgiN